MTRVRRERVGGPRRFAESHVVDERGFVVPVDATTYVRMPPELAVFDPVEWPSDCGVPGCELGGVRHWRTARADWCERWLTFDEAWADDMAMVAATRGAGCFHPGQL